MRFRANAVRTALLGWYETNGRAQLPWRVVRNPYFTLVSEFMLQQTQVDRVVPTFAAFVLRFPDVAALADASLADVLRAWKGLGYNSRAVRLKRVAETVVAQHGGVMPSDAVVLRSLPGVGPYTAAAIRAFAFGLDDAPLDTNVRRIVHRLRLGVEHPARAPVGELGALARELAPAGRAHDWNSALMDLGATICTARAPKCAICPLRRVCAAAPIDPASLERRRKTASNARPTRASLPFVKTTRYARGRIVDSLRELPAGERISLLDLHRQLVPLIGDRSLDDVRGFVVALEREGLIANDGERIALRE